MDIDYKSLLGIITVIIGLLSYMPYIRDMIKGDTKPHIFTWFLRGVGAWIVFAGQWSSGAGAGSRANIVVGLVCFFVPGYALFHGAKKYITLSDCIVFGLALCAFISYFLTRGRFRSILLINIADILSIVPSIRKSRYDPFSETISFYAINILEFSIMILALAQYSFVTASNTILRIVLNTTMVVFLFIRRRKLSNPKSSPHSTAGQAIYNS